MPTNVPAPPADLAEVIRLGRLFVRLRIARLRLKVWIAKRRISAWFRGEQLPPMPPPRA
jgi:hypothetical protein